MLNSNLIFSIESIWFTLSTWKLVKSFMKRQRLIDTLHFIANTRIMNPYIVKKMFKNKETLRMLQHYLFDFESSHSSFTSDCLIGGRLSKQGTICSLVGSKKLEMVGLSIPKILKSSASHSILDKGQLSPEFISSLFLEGNQSISISQTSKSQGKFGGILFYLIEKLLDSINPKQLKTKEMINFQKSVQLSVNSVPQHPQNVIMLATVVSDRFTGHTYLRKIKKVALNRKDIIKHYIRKTRRLSLEFTIMTAISLLLFFLLLNQFKKISTRMLGRYCRWAKQYKRNKLKTLFRLALEDFKCSSCRIRPKNIIFKPCLHFEVCTSCYKLDKFNSKCHQCDEKVINGIQIYNA